MILTLRKHPRTHVILRLYIRTCFFKFPAGVRALLVVIMKPTSVPMQMLHPFTVSSSMLSRGKETLSSESRSGYPLNTAGCAAVVVACRQNGSAIPIHKLASRAGCRSVRVNKVAPYATLGKLRLQFAPIVPIVLRMRNSLCRTPFYTSA